MTAPDLILMDEPSEGLAPLLVEQLNRAIREMCGHGVSVLLVEQNLPFALKCADHVYVMHRGEIVYSATPAALRADEAVKTQYLGASV
jgi:branched-chain amino acid transport system ATP-binding protein